MSEFKTYGEVIKEHRRRADDAEWEGDTYLSDHYERLVKLYKQEMLRNGYDEHQYYIPF